mgnify:CR=1 FL=1
MILTTENIEMNNDDRKNEPSVTRTIVDDDGQQLSFRKVGGFDLLVDRPFVTDDQQSLLIISGRKIRKYFIENGNFLEEYYFGINASIVTIQRNENPNECWLAFENGHIIQWNYWENFRISQMKIPSIDRSHSLVYYKRIDNICYFVTKLLMKKKNTVRYKLQYYYQNNPENQMLIDRSMNFSGKFSTKSISFSSNGQICAVINLNQLFIYELPISLTSRKQIYNCEDKNKHFTVIRFHPIESILVTGDTNGQIHIWNDLFATNRQPIKSILHWHSQSVADLVYSPNGTNLYSVGNEMVLVKWNLVGQNFGEKTFVPRLGEKIYFVTIDKNNEFVITSHLDQSIQIIDAKMNGIRTVIEGLSFSKGNNLYRSAVGLHFNHRLESIAMNGRIGHLQFYSPFYQRQLFQLDITEQNIIVAPTIRSSRSRKHSIEEVDKDNFIPIQVTRLAINDDGYWMATIEYRNDEETSPEIRLKFWLLLPSNNGFELNTTVHLPHDDDINYMEFSTSNSSSSLQQSKHRKLPSELHLVTTSQDKTFKIWDLKTSAVASGNRKQWWNCSRQGSLNNNSVPRMASFSSDSSLLAVLFDENHLTMWELNSNESNNDIRYIPRMDIFDIFDNNGNDNDDQQQQQKSIENNRHIIYIGFGQKQFSHYLIEGHRRGLIVRNVVRKFQKIFEYNIPTKCNDNNVLPIDSIVRERGENILALIALDRIRFLCLQQQSVVAYVDLATMKNFRGTIISSVFLPLKFDSDNHDDDNQDDGELSFKQNYLCLTDQNELFRTISSQSNTDGGKNILDDYSETIMVGTQNDLRTETFIRNIDDNYRSNNCLATLMAINDDDDESSKQKLSDRTTKSTSELIKKYFYHIPSHVLPPVHILEKSFLSDYLQTLQLSSSITTKIDEKIDNEKKSNNDDNSRQQQPSDDNQQSLMTYDRKIFESNSIIDDNYDDGGDNPIKSNDFFWLNQYVRSSLVNNDDNDPKTIDGATTD